MQILAQCEKRLIHNTILEARSTIEVVEKRMEDLDGNIDLVNDLEEAAFVELQLPPRDDFIESLYMMKEKKVSMNEMRDEFNKVIKKKQFQDRMELFGKTWSALIP